MDPAFSAGVSDLAQLTNLTEDSLIANLKARFLVGQIYTYIGDILLVINPYESLPYYTPEIQAAYLSNVHREDVAPHVYYLVNNAYETMLRVQTSQAFVISGESGAGKSETTKHVVNHIIELCKAGNKTLESGIQKLNPLLEAFGNARTVMNNNSSRFGKYLELRFDRTGAVVGAEISEYLLEKSRVTQHSDGERNYHFFYYLLAGLNPEELNRMGLGIPRDHHYLGGATCEAFDDSTMTYFKGTYNKLMLSFKNVGFDNKDVTSLTKMLAGLLLLGDVEFDEDENDAATLISIKKLELVAEHLGVDFAGLSQCLLGLSLDVGGETTWRLFSKQKAVDTRDALSRSLYARMFGWLVTVCNANLVDKEATQLKSLTLGILDIFGFENFAVNSLEQLCINTTNERLHSYFNQIVFANEQEGYRAEEVDIEKFTFTDNTSTLDLVLKPKGIFHILNEESRFPKASDLTFVQKCATLKNHESKSYIPSASDLELMFEIVHYAGAVKYSSEGFLLKNRDTMSSDVVNVLRFSEDMLVEALWTAPKTNTGTFRVSRATRTQKPKKASTVASSFTFSLGELMDKINKCQPHFVRCLKPNGQKTKKVWDKALVHKQLQYAGALETVRIRKLGWPSREPYTSFVQRYKSIAFKLSDEIENTKEVCEVILTAAGLKDYALGKSKVFLKHFHQDELASHLRKQRMALYFIQKVCLAYIARFRYRLILKQRGSQDAVVASHFEDIEKSCEASRSSMVNCCHIDALAAQKRRWLQSIKLRAEQAAIAKASLEKDEAEKARVEQMRRFMVTKKRGKVVNGGHVFVRNENLTIRVGKLAPFWEKKIDKATGRPYFKNHKTRETTWVDPRTKYTRKKDADGLLGEELPFGWDEAEIHGETYYIDHNTQQTHWVHPHEVLANMRQEYFLKEKGVQSRAEVFRANLKELRAKKKRLTDLKAEATDQEIIGINERILATDAVIAKELVALQEVAGENLQLRNDIKNLKDQFDHQEFVSTGQAGNVFAPGDVKDLYAHEKMDSDTLTKDAENEHLPPNVA
eukprot:m.139111 g.139111  ORF g.139111 m.139111 type:complete len:1040 (-) comp30035_c0_seq1:88-3207(-)